MSTSALPLSRLCGQLIVGGFDGPDVTPRFAAALADGRRGGAILFKRNLPDIATASRLCRAIAAAAPADLPPFLGVDQEGGRVTRMPPPFLTLPPMRVLGEIGDLDLIRRAARAVGTELAAVGFNLDFAPVLDVDSNPANPVIGDRSFSRDPDLVARAGVAFGLGLQDAGVLACGKHFPGHGDTSADSHFDLPIIAHDRARLDRVELPPFRAAAGAGIATLMTAHVVCEGLDPSVPATLSRAVCTNLLRGELGFWGALFSDDLEMAAVAARYSVEDSAVAAVEAGCDVLLVCKQEDLQDRAHEALVKKAEQDAAFRRRCVEAVDRGLRVRRQAPPKAGDVAAVGSEAGRGILEEIAARRGKVAG
jgi:beta-N-acetylhexosaminidase